MGSALFKNWGNTDIPTIANRKQISPLFTKAIHQSASFEYSIN